MVVYSFTFTSLLVTFLSKFEGEKNKVCSWKKSFCYFTSLAIRDKVGSTLQGIPPLHIDTKTTQYSLSLDIGSLQDVTMRNTHRKPFNQSPAYSCPLDKCSANFPCIPWNSRVTQHVTGTGEACCQLCDCLHFPDYCFPFPRLQFALGKHTPGTPR